MSRQSATIIGIVLQAAGGGYLVWQSWNTSRALKRHVSGPVTFDNLGTAIDTFAQELGGQFRQQLVGFAFLLVGSGFQLYAAAA
ncbi:hypothetical protein [Lysobacter claricitrinus]|uniref:hypothetical protein n=1 Tax=Lysobacter claricitrinus TaxID=3367728 RepID=UPI0037DBBD87